MSPLLIVFLGLDALVAVAMVVAGFWAKGVERRLTRLENDLRSVVEGRR